LWKNHIDARLAHPISFMSPTREHKRDRPHSCHSVSRLSETHDAASVCHASARSAGLGGDEQPEYPPCCAEVSAGGAIIGPRDGARLASKRVAPRKDTHISLSHHMSSSKECVCVCFQLEALPWRGLFGTAWRFPAHVGWLGSFAKLAEPSPMKR
jgi:hypothetical protein